MRLAEVLLSAVALPIRKKTLTPRMVGKAY